MKSDIIYEQEYNGARTPGEDIASSPGTYCGLILLTDTETARPLAILNDGLTQLTRVGADGGIGVRYLAKANAEVVGMLGLRRHVAERTWKPSCMCGRASSACRSTARPRTIVSASGARWRISTGSRCRSATSPEQIYRGADIVAALTDSAVSVIDGARIEKGAHLVAPGMGGGLKDRASP
jgi:ornithine cyclodeaminase/alanine dehydrogenase-like protein (mu-crystallin family)